MDSKTLVQQCIQKCQTSASDMRQAASQTTSSQAKNTLTSAATQLDACVKQCESIITQL
ncbi:MAG: hypothetical protein ACM3QW_04745 [Ignavibacteriales bacterium]